MTSLPQGLTQFGRPSDGVRIAKWPPAPRARLGPFGAERPLTEEEGATVEMLRRFAEDEMRPAGEALDRMTADDVVAPGSPLWRVHAKYRELGLHVDQLLGMAPLPRARALCLAFELLGWGDLGLACSLGSGIGPRYVARLFGNDYLAELCPDDAIGCVAFTEPDHGNDMLDPDGLAAHPRGSYGRPNCVATIQSDRIVINGRKAAWVSNGPIAQVCLLFCAADTGAGADARHGAAVIVPCDAPGVSKGKPLDKMWPLGQLGAGQEDGTPVGRGDRRAVRDPASPRHRADLGLQSRRPLARDRGRRGWPAAHLGRGDGPRPQGNPWPRHVRPAPCRQPGRCAGRRMCLGPAEGE